MQIYPPLETTREDFMAVVKKICGPHRLSEGQKNFLGYVERNGFNVEISQKNLKQKSFRKLAAIMCARYRAGGIPSFQIIINNELTHVQLFILSQS